MFPPLWCFYMMMYLHCLKTQEKTALSHKLPQNLSHLWAKLVWFRSAVNCSSSYNADQLGGMILVPFFVLTDQIILRLFHSYLILPQSCLRNFSIVLQVSRSHITYFSILLKTEEPGHLHKTGLSQTLSIRESRQNLPPDCPQTPSFKALLQYLACLNLDNLCRMNANTSLAFPCRLWCWLGEAGSPMNMRS